ncbi:hypothetical protein BDN67DRAFT_1004550 [Paxillus ammoniavirescens]|nr:hypothetical protein BDN67DRAFT_1004550 [Paxillus ammoniavirescens]
MKTFWTLLTAITLSVYTLVGVAGCANCPVKVAGKKLERQCTTGGVTTCTYHNTKKDFYCYYNPTSGYLDTRQGAYSRSCPKSVHTNTDWTQGWRRMPISNVKDTGPALGTKAMYFIQPTIFTECQPHIKIVQEDIFGPVAYVVKFKTEQAGSVLSRPLEEGTMRINCANLAENQMPFGGFKQSGIGRKLERPFAGAWGCLQCELDVKLRQSSCGIGPETGVSMLRSKLTLADVRSTLRIMTSETEVLIVWRYVVDDA